MSEFPSGTNPEPLENVAYGVAELGMGFVRRRDFLGRKVAQEFMDEVGLSGTLDEVGEAALADLLGVCVTGGIVLGMRKTTDEASVQEEMQRLHDGLPEPLQPSIGRLIPMLVPRGIAFQRDELSQNSPKVQGWFREFNLLDDSTS